MMAVCDVGGGGIGDGEPALTLSHKPTFGRSVLDLALGIAFITEFFLQPKKLQPRISLTLALRSGLDKHGWWGRRW